MAPCPSIMSKSKVSITVLCLLCSPYYTAVIVAARENTDVHVLQLSSETEVSIALLCQLRSTSYTQQYESRNV